MLEINELTVICDGTPLIDGLSLKIEEKGIFGILCADSAQRDILASVLCGAKNANGGEILYNEKPMSREATDLKRKVRLATSGLSPDPSMTSFEYLELVGNALGLDAQKKHKQIEEALELTGLTGNKNRIFKKLDAEMKIKLSIAAALLGNPDFIIVIEPFENIDKEAHESLYELLCMLGTLKTLILFSHEPEKVKRLCRSVAIISQGRCVLNGDIEDIERKINATHEMEIKVKGNADKINAAIKSQETVVNVKILSTEANGVHTISVEHYPDDTIKDRLFCVLSEINAPMLSVKHITLTLNDVYYSLCENKEEKA